MLLKRQNEKLCIITSKKDKNAAGAPVHFEIYILHPIHPARDGIKFIVLTGDGDSIIQNEGPFGPIYSANVATTSPRVFLILPLHNVERIMSHDLKLRAQVPCTATAPMPSIFIPRSPT